MLTDREPVALLTQGDLMEGLREGLPEEVAIIDLAETSGSIRRRIQILRAEGLGARHLAYVMYTSDLRGSQGRDGRASKCDRLRDLG